ncbi:ty3-gypsy retrotransposon protein [Cucumis melo var. makuwa]|uniref:Ty3-gypsy retrotransposon protein n=1 Tax=Cucumis melo var. makuwa TaxID=1194695 RepID=A0A5D3E4P6_CUCMM|nr:ty3-gypsy retrotransposon protein [Cucumis melo var. makuwa]TYK31083.1 ty3-gypsy retrotransposon protein [Cucumis melo var. makuwa]
MSSGTSLPLIVQIYKQINGTKEGCIQIFCCKRCLHSTCHPQSFKGDHPRAGLRFVIGQSILKQLMESPKAGIVIKENSLYDKSDSASSKSKKEAHPNVVSIMMADVTIKAVVAEMERKINLLMQVVEERNHEIVALRKHTQTHETAKSS